MYWHFRDKRALADAVAAAMLHPEAWPGPDTPGLAPEAWLAERARAFRQALLQHRDGAAIHAGTAPEPALLPGLNRQLAALVEHGLSPDDALRTVLAISRYTIGWVLEEQAQMQREDGGAMTAVAASAPVLTQARGVVDRGNHDADFNFGLDALIAGAMRHRRVA